MALMCGTGHLTLFLKLLTARVIVITAITAKTTNVFPVRINGLGSATAFGPLSSSRIESIA